MPPLLIVESAELLAPKQSAVENYDELEMMDISSYCNGFDLEDLDLYETFHGHEETTGNCTIRTKRAWSTDEISSMSKIDIILNDLLALCTIMCGDYEEALSVSSNKASSLSKDLTLQSSAFLEKMCNIRDAVFEFLGLLKHQEQECACCLKKIGSNERIRKIQILNRKYYFHTTCDKEINIDFWVQHNVSSEDDESLANNGSSANKFSENIVSALPATKKST